MAILICKACQVAFEGRPNRRYCSPTCKGDARKLARERQRQERHAAWLKTLSPEQRAGEARGQAVWDSIATTWSDLPAADWSGDLPAEGWTKELPADWSDLPAAEWDDVPAGDWSALKPWTWDEPTTTK